MNTWENRIFTLFLIAMILQITGPATSPGQTSGVQMPANRTAASASNLLLFDNGPLITSYDIGADEADVSELQTSLGMSMYGIPCGISQGYRVADNFYVASSWHVESVTLFAYQPHSGTTSTITDTRIQIWQGHPMCSGVVIWGDMTTNRISWTGWSDIYRVPELEPLNSDRPIMLARCEVSIDLDPGLYWLDWSYDGSLSSGPWQPPVTLKGNPVTGDALRYTTDWVPVIDNGSLSTLGVPFMIRGRYKNAEIIDFDGLPPDVDISDYCYTGVGFSGWWSKTGDENLPSFSPFNVACTKEVNNFISWISDLELLCFYASCRPVADEVWEYSVLDVNNALLDTFEISGSARNQLVEFRSPGIRRLEVRGTGLWKDNHVIDDLVFEWATSVTPTPAPTCTVMGCEVFMPSSDFTAGDTCYCDVYVCNTESVTYTNIPLFVILDVYGTYFFAPSFGSFDSFNDPIAPGLTVKNVLPAFEWPSGAGSASNIVWYAAMTDPDVTELFGELGTFTFGWH